MKRANYRVNYGNGQVSSTMTLSECRTHLAACIASNLDPYTAYYRIQRYDGEGEWVAVKPAKEVA